MSRAGWLACVALGAWGALVSPARACGVEPCFGGFVLPASGVVPADLPELSWTPRLPSSLHDSFFVPELVAGLSVTKVGASGTEERVAVRLETRENRNLAIVPVSGSFGDPGDRLHFSLPSACPDDTDGGVPGVRPPREIDLSIGPPAGPPAGDLTLTVSGLSTGSLAVRSWGGGCTEDVRAVSTEVTAELPDAARPWLPAMRFEALVDSAPWTYERSLVLPPEELEASLWGEPDALLYAACNRVDGIDNGLPEGRHRIVMRAWVPGMEPELVSDPVELRLVCGARSSAVFVPAGGGCSASGDAPRRTELWPLIAVGVCVLRRRSRRSPGPSRSRRRQGDGVACGGALG